MTNVAVVGTGSAGTRHIANLLQLGCNVTAVSEHTRRPELTVAGSDIPVLIDYASALAAADAVVIANPTSLHLDYARAAVEAGRHVLCEKPVAASAVGVAELARAAEQRGVIFAVGVQFRFNEALCKLRDRVVSGDLGTLIDVDATQGEHLGDYHPDEDYRLSYAARSELGGGILLTQIHQIDFLQWIFGPFDRVFAVGGCRTGLELDVEDTVSYLLRRPDGLAVRGHLDFVQRPRRMELTAIGTKGRIRWDYYANELEFVPSDPDGTPDLDRAPFDRNPMFVGLLHDFLDAVRNDRRPRATASDAAEVLRLVDAMKVSIASGQAVEVDVTTNDEEPRA